jgi:hypothetical protein
MYDGVKEMIKREKELAPKASAPAAKAAPAKASPAPVAASAPAKLGANVKAGPHLKKQEDITGCVDFPAGTKSLLCKYLTKDVMTKYFG